MVMEVYDMAMVLGYIPPNVHPQTHPFKEKGSEDFVVNQQLQPGLGKSLSWRRAKEMDSQPGSSKTLGFAQTCCLFVRDIFF